MSALSPLLPVPLVCADIGLHPHCLSPATASPTNACALYAAMPTLTPAPTPMPTDALDTNSPTWVRKPTVEPLTNGAASASLCSAQLPSYSSILIPGPFFCCCRRFVPHRWYNLQLPYRFRLSR